MSYEEYLFNLLEREVMKREENQVRRLINQARFPLKKTLDSFDFGQIPGLSQTKVLTLSRCQFIRDKENIILAGNSGTGKTHLAIALGISAAQLRYKVGFYTAAGLVNELTEMEGEKKLSRFQKQWLRYDLVIVDELGYIPFSRRSAELLFQFFSSRYERGSMIITTNLEFPEWNQIFGDEKMTAALLDRVTHNAHILITNGESYRLKQTLKRRRESDS
ncbi:MAG TPA: ATP-binding protein [Syntrophothermus lipocalidus]|nr:ATP-binding protein [Syntrophothermus lipocalidus]